MASPSGFSALAALVARDRESFSAILARQGYRVVRWVESGAHAARLEWAERGTVWQADFRRSAMPATSAAAWRRTGPLQAMRPARAA